MPTLPTIAEWIQVAEKYLEFTQAHATYDQPDAEYLLGELKRVQSQQGDFHTLDELAMKTFFEMLNVESDLYPEA